MGLTSGITTFRIESELFNTKLYSNFMNLYIMELTYINVCMVVCVWSNMCVTVCVCVCWCVCVVCMYGVCVTYVCVYIYLLLPHF